jgi:DNA gyrase subunit B
VFEVVDNSVDEALAGHCSEITVVMNSDGSIEVSDNGRGIPCAVHPSTGKSSLETVLCVLHAGGKFGGESSGYRVSGGLHGVGLSVVNALSEELVVKVVRDSTFHTMSFSKGLPLSDIIMRPSREGVESRGTAVRFRPDPSIFKTTVVFDFDRLATRLDELAYLNAGLTIHLLDKRSKAQILHQIANSKMLTEQAEEISSLEDRASGDTTDSEAPASP